jgi:xylan 1,4-beta-xylosidase
MKLIKLLLVILMAIPTGFHTKAQQKTYCNPMNLDYGFTPIPNFSEWGKHRATADPVIVNYKGDFYLFSTNQRGYWWSPDLSNWTFVSKSFLRPEHQVYDDLCAPAVWVQGDTLLVFGSTYSSTFPIWMSTNPKENEWKEVVHKFDIGGWDPAFFVDDDSKLYMYNGSSNKFPLYGIELNRKTFEPYGTREPLLLLDDDRFGWHRFGENMDNTFLDPFIEGAWMTKYNGKYYLQYGAPGTEFSGYADGVAISDKPLNGFQHQSLPLSYKPGGFTRGAGHGSTFQDNWGNYWHVSTVPVSVKNNFERRNGFWPAGFDKDDVMYCNTVFGDFPHYLPDGKADHLQSRFAGWMILNYNKPVTVSSTFGSFYANNAVDEKIQTYWCAASDKASEWISSDLGEVSTVRAIQINYADQDATILGKSTEIYHQYKLWYSMDGKKWSILIDKSKNTTDVPHDYIELSQPVEARFIKLDNIHMANGKFAISGLRVFGNGHGEKPGQVKNFIVLRTEKDKRNAWLKWKPVDNAFAYNIYTGIDAGKLYNCIMVYGSNEYWFKAMDKEKPYYFTIEAINENGVSTRTEIIKSE